MNEIYSKSRILFVISNCPICQVWKSFIERLNMELPIKKRIRVIDCTAFNSLGITNYGIIDLFESNITSFPTLFLEGIKLEGANSREEVEAFIRGYLDEDFVIKRDNSYLFKKNCRYVNKGLFKRKTLVCGDTDEM